MKRRIFESETIFDRWGVIQERFSEGKLPEEFRLRRIGIKEGVCEECGAFDTLLRIEEKFICGECAKLIKSLNRK